MVEIKTGQGLEGASEGAQGGDGCFVTGSGFLLIDSLLGRFLREGRQKPCLGLGETKGKEPKVGVVLLCSWGRAEGCGEVRQAARRLETLAI